MSSTRSVPVPVPPSPARAERAFRLFEERGHLIRSIAADTFEVPSSGLQGRRYTVRYGGHVAESCSCPDRDYHPGLACKHLLAVGIMHARRRSGVREVRTFDVAAGDPFLAAGKRRLRQLEERYHHELMDDEERMELRDRIIRMRSRSRS